MYRSGDAISKMERRGESVGQSRRGSLNNRVKIEAADWAQPSGQIICIYLEDIPVGGVHFHSTSLRVMFVIGVTMSTAFVAVSVAFVVAIHENFLAVSRNDLRQVSHKQCMEAKPQKGQRGYRKGLGSKDSTSPLKGPHEGKERWKSILTLQIFIPPNRQTIRLYFASPTGISSFNHSLQMQRNYSFTITATDDDNGSARFNSFHNLVLCWRSVVVLLSHVVRRWLRLRWGWKRVTGCRGLGGAGSGLGGAARGSLRGAGCLRSTDGVSRCGGSLALLIGRTAEVEAVGRTSRVSLGADDPDVRVGIVRAA